MQLLIDLSILPRLSVLGGVILSYIVSRKKETFILPVSELEKKFMLTKYQQKQILDELQEKDYIQFYLNSRRERAVLVKNFDHLVKNFDQAWLKNLTRMASCQNDENVIKSNSDTVTSSLLNKHLSKLSQQLEPIQSKADIYSDIINYWNNSKKLQLISLSNLFRYENYLFLLTRKYSLDDIKQAINNATQSEFLTKNFQIKFIWFIKEENFKKVLEGVYSFENKNKKNEYNILNELKEL
tara:strand:- start:865 stop:1584 length:720 start_codon:yes stop_codon:yes gene_type:complete